MAFDSRCANKACDRDRDGDKKFCRPCAAAFLIGVNRGRLDTPGAPDAGRPSTALRLGATESRSSAEDSADRLASLEVFAGIVADTIGAMLDFGFGVPTFAVERVIGGEFGTGTRGYFFDEAAAAIQDALVPRSGRVHDFTRPRDTVSMIRRDDPWIEIRGPIDRQPAPGDTVRFATPDGEVFRGVVRGLGSTTESPKRFWAYVLAEHVHTLSVLTDPPPWSPPDPDR